MPNKNWLVMLCVLLVICGCDQASQSTRTYRHAMDGSPASLDPALASTIYAHFLVVNLYDTLYRYKYLARPYALEPNLAEGMPEWSEDGLSLTIRLKKGVRFMDDPAFPGGKGREVTADDFVFSIKRHFDPETLAQGAWLWQGRIAGLDEWKAAGSDYAVPVEGLKAIDTHTVQIHLTAPFPQMVHTLTQGFAAVVPPEAVAMYGRGLGSHPVGSGPFRLVSFDSARAIMEPNPAFRREPFSLENEGFDATTQNGLGLETLEGRSPPFVDRLEIEFIDEDAARWNAFISGQVHHLKVPVTQFDRVLASRQPPRLADEFKEDYVLDASLESGFVYTNFNMDDPRIGYHPDPQQNLRNRALRCAIVRGFDWPSRNDLFFGGIGKVFPGIIPPAATEFDASQPDDYVRRDVEGAKQLLADHGWHADNLPPLEYGFSAGVTQRQTFEQFRSFMQDIGYPAGKITPLVYASYGDYARAYAQRKVMLITSSWNMDYPDAENTIQLFYGPNAAPGSNSANFNDPEFDRLYRLSAPMQPSTERTRLYRQMNQLVMDECATISGIARTLLLMWNREAVMKPDRSFTAGYYLRFVDIQERP